MRLRALTDRDVEQVLPMGEAIKAVAKAYSALSCKEASMPLRLGVEAPKGSALLMPAYLPATGDLAVKVVTVFGENPARGLSTVHALVVALDPDTGRPVALMDGRRLTALRTGAASGVATDLLSREESRVMALFGAGGQAPDQVEAVLAVRPVEEVRIYTPSGVSATSLAERLRKAHSEVDFFVALSPSEAVRGADVISCATTSSTPVFDPEDVSPGAHINGIGSF